MQHVITSITYKTTHLLKKILIYKKIFLKQFLFNTQFASQWDQNTPFLGVFNFGLNPERVAGENKLYILIQNFKRNRMAFSPDFYLLWILRYLNFNKGGSNIWGVR